MDHVYKIHPREGNSNCGFSFHSESKKDAHAQAKAYANYLQETELHNQYFKRPSYDGLRHYKKQN